MNNQSVHLLFVAGIRSTAIPLPLCRRATKTLGHRCEPEREPCSRFCLAPERATPADLTHSSFRRRAVAGAKLPLGRTRLQPPPLPREPPAALPSSCASPDPRRALSPLLSSTAGATRARICGPPAPAVLSCPCCSLHTSERAISGQTESASLAGTVVVHLRPPLQDLALIFRLRLMILLRIERNFRNLTFAYDLFELGLGLGAVQEHGGRAV